MYETRLGTRRLFRMAVFNTNHSAIAANPLSTRTSGLSSLLMRQFRLLTCLCNYKFASLLNKNFLWKSQSMPPRFRLFRRTCDALDKCSASNWISLARKPRSLRKIFYKVYGHNFNICVWGRLNSIRVFFVTLFNRRSNSVFGVHCGRISLDETWCQIDLWLPELSTLPRNIW